MKNAKNTFGKASLFSLLSLIVLATGTTAFALVDTKTASGEETSFVELSDFDFAKLENMSEEDFIKELQESGEFFEDEDINILFGQDFIDFEDPTEGVISEQDWDTLSMKQIDEKMKRAGKEIIGDPKDPLYEFTPAQIDELTEKEWEILDKQYEELYGEDDFELTEEDFPEFRTEIIEEIQNDYNAIKKDLSGEIQKKIEDSIKKLSSTDDEESFFEIIDTMYELVADELEAYWESLFDAE